MLKLFECLKKIGDPARKSIFTHVAQHLDPSGPGLLPGGIELPDDDEFGQLGRVVFIPGSPDVLGGSPGQVPLERVGNLVDEIVKALRKISGNPTVDRILHLETLFSVRDTLSVIDPVLRRIVTTDGLDQSVIYQVCRHLFLTSRRRGVVKFCISVLGLYGVPQDLELFTTIARHPEFTLYAAVAVIFPGKCPECIWMELVPSVEGWGRIHLVNRLLDIETPEVERFLITTGSKNRFLPAYSACSIARRVNLLKLLKKRTIDRDTFSGAGALIRAMISATGSAGPLEGIDRCDNGSAACREYVRHASKMAQSLEDLMTVAASLKLANLGEPRGESRFHWDEKHRKYVVSRGRKIIDDESWPVVIIDAVKSCSDDIVESGLAAGREIGLDLSGKVREMLEENPWREALWHYLVEVTDEEGIEELASFGARLLEKTHVCSSGGVVGTICYNDPRDLCLETLCRGLYPYPGVGGKLLGTALESPEYYTCMEAVRVLCRWDNQSVTPELVDLAWKLRESCDPEIQVAGEALIRRWSN